MNLSQLYYFQKLAELQHYTHAAEELFISQPTLSHAISSLEEDLGCQLFQKEGRNVRLTEDGILFREYVDRSLGILDEGIAALKKRQGRLSGTVSLGAISTVRSDFLPAAILAYRRTRGSLVDLRISQGPTEVLVHSLKHGDIDLAIASKINEKGFVFTPLFEQRLVVAVVQGHPLASRKSISIQELKDYEVYTYREDTQVGTEIDAFLRKNDIRPEDMNLNRDVDDELMLGGLVAKEPVIGLVLLTSGLLPYRNLHIIPLKEESSKNVYPIGILRLEDARPNPAAQDFEEFLEKFPVAHQMLPEQG